VAWASAWVGIALLLGIPLAAAQAAPVAGELSTSAISIAPTSQGSAVLEAGYWPDASAVSALRFASPVLGVHVFEFERVDTLPLRNYVLDRSRTFELHNAEATQDGASGAGWLGYYADPSGDAVSLDAGSLDVAPTIRSLGNTASEAAGARESGVAFYSFLPHGAYLLAEGPLRVERSGASSIKVYGPTLVLAGRENTSTYWTGARPSTTTPGATTVRWILLTSGAGGVMAVDAEGPVQLALANATLVTAGTLQVRQAQGSLKGEAGTYVATGGDAILSGKLALRLRPENVGLPTLAVDLDGTIESTSLGFARAAVPLGSPPGFFLWGAGLLAVAAAVVGTRLLRARKPTALTPEQLTDLAYVAADSGRYGEALEWIEKAIQRAPTSERLRMDEASFHAELGHVDEALVRYDALAAASLTGEPDYHAAALLQATGNPEAAVAHLLRALDRTPHLALELREDVSFGDARRDPRIVRAVSAALRRLDDGNLGEGSGSRR
jgi:hypothetical protein